MVKKKDHHSLLEVIYKEIESDKLSLPKISILFLARYNYTLKNAKEFYGEIKECKKYELLFSTVHTSKGTEADYVVVLDLNNGKYGFPCEISDDPIINEILAKKDDFQHAEERRLFYVALTRAKQKVFLVADPSKLSVFFVELADKNHGYDVHYDASVTNEFYGCCPSCQTGRLITRNNPKNHKLFLGCTNYRLCKYTTPFCKKCEIGFIEKINHEARCSNEECGYKEKACPRCLEGMLVERKGRYGAFWGCLNYPKCEYTEKFYKAF